MTNKLLGDDWVPEACTLPTVEQPLRREEFDILFAHDVFAVHRESSRRIRLDLRPDPEVVSRAAGLAVKEASCCSFFTFDLFIADGSASLSIETPVTHQTVLAALRCRAESRIGGAS